MVRLIPVLLLCMGFTGCTIRIVDDSHDYDINAEVISNVDGECSIRIKRVESKQQTEAKAKTQ